jgi:hypothetical protein
VCVFFSDLAGVRILDGIVTDSLEGEALSFNRDYINIYSASWGPSDDGKTMEGPNKFATKAFEDGVRRVCIFCFYHPNCSYMYHQESFICKKLLCFIQVLPISYF